MSVRGEGGRGSEVGVKDWEMSRGKGADNSSDGGGKGGWKGWCTSKC